ncbi:MAG: OmpA family protein [Pseudomonadota bacterium]
MVEPQDSLSETFATREAALEKLKADLLSDQNDLDAQLETLKSRQEQTAQREADLDAEAKQLDEKLASLNLREEELARMQENLRLDGDALEDRQAELQKQEESVAARLKTVLERENQLAANEQELATQRAAFLAQGQIEITESRPDLVTDPSVPKSAVDQTLAGVELSTVALREPAIADKNLETRGQAEPLAEADATGNGTNASPDAPIAEVHFEQNSARLTPGGLERARAAAARLQNTKFSKVRITGHTDTTGSASQNQVLSNLRAEAVAEIFVQAGVSRQAIEVVGFGETYAMLPVSTADGISEPLNRCVGIFVD